jgi:uncharacterized protein YjbJ (UPF0337 family)
MDWNRIEGNWKQFAGTAKHKWGKLTDDHLAAIAGRRDQLSGKIQELYGLTKESTERQIEQWQKDQRENAGGDA